MNANRFLTLSIILLISIFILYCLFGCAEDNLVNNGQHIGLHTTVQGTPRMIHRCDNVNIMIEITNYSDDAIVLDYDCNLFDFVVVDSKGDTMGRGIIPGCPPGTPPKQIELDPYESKSYVSQYLTRGIVVPYEDYCLRTGWYTVYGGLIQPLNIDYPWSKDVFRIRD